MDVGNGRVVGQANCPFNACIPYIRVHQNVHGPATPAFKQSMAVTITSAALQSLRRPKPVMAYFGRCARHYYVTMSELLAAGGGFSMRVGYSATHFAPKIVGAVLALTSGLSVHATPPFATFPNAPVNQFDATETKQAAVPESTTLFATPTQRDQSGRIVVPVMINGQGPFRFVLDTGANRSVLASHMLAKLGLTVSAENLSVELSGVTGQAIVRTVAVKQLQAGALELKNLDMPVIDATMAGLDGVLGTEGLEGKRLTVDFMNDRITIENSYNQRAPPGYLVISTQFRYGLLMVVDAMVGRVKTKAVIDTGAENSLGTESLRRTLQSQNTDRVAGSARVEGVTAEVQTGDLVFAPLIRFNNAEITGVKITYGDFHVFKLWELTDKPALLVGMDVLGTVNTLIIDYGRRELQIKSRNNTLVPIPK
jgi:predicted aspartyl protease